MYVPSGNKKVVEGGKKVEDIKKSPIVVKKKKRKKPKFKAKKELIYDGMGKSDKYDDYDIW